MGTPNQAGLPVSQEASSPNCWKLACADLEWFLTASKAALWLHHRVGGYSSLSSKGQLYPAQRPIIVNRDQAVEVFALIVANAITGRLVSIFF